MLSTFSLPSSDEQFFAFFVVDLHLNHHIINDNNNKVEAAEAEDTTVAAAIEQ